MSSNNQFFKITFTHINRVDSHSVIGFGTDEQAEAYASSIKQRGNIWSYLITSVDAVPSNLNYSFGLVDLQQYSKPSASDDSLVEFVFCGRVFDRENEIMIVFAENQEKAEAIFTKNLLESFDVSESDDLEVVIESWEEINKMRLNSLGISETSTITEKSNHDAENIVKNEMIHEKPIKLVDHRVVFINTDNYSTVEAAEIDGATYYTGSSIDALSFIDDGVMSGFYDMLEVIRAMQKCLGMEQPTGFVKTNQGYMSLDEYSEHLSD